MIRMLNKMAKSLIQKHCQSNSRWTRNGFVMATIHCVRVRTYIRTYLVPNQFLVGSDNVIMVFHAGGVGTSCRSLGGSGIERVGMSGVQSALNVVCEGRRRKECGEKRREDDEGGGGGRRDERGVRQGEEWEGGRKEGGRRGERKEERKGEME